MKYLLAVLIFLCFASVASAQTITWTCDRCTPASGTATGTSTWSLPPLTLKPGINIITVTATASDGSTGTDTIAVTYVPTFPGNARVLALGFEDGSGTTATDSSGNANTGTLVGTPTWLASGRYGKALTFNGTSQYVRVPRTNNTLELSQSFTLSAWVNPSASTPGFQPVIHKNSAANAGGPGSPYEIFSNITGFCGDAGYMGLVTVNGIQTPSQRFNACSAAPLQANNWTHIAVTYNNAAGQLKLYRNGVLITTTAALGYMENSDLELFIGTSEFGEFFAGSIDEVRVYNFAIPLAGTLNVTPNGACNSTEANTAATASIIGDMNCPIVPLASPIAFKIGSASSLKIGSGSTLKVGSAPQ